MNTQIDENDNDQINKYLRGLALSDRVKYKQELRRFKRRDAKLKCLFWIAFLIVYLPLTWIALCISSQAFYNNYFSDFFVYAIVYVIPAMLILFLRVCGKPGESLKHSFNWAYLYSPSILGLFVWIITGLRDRNILQGSLFYALTVTIYCFMFCVGHEIVLSFILSAKDKEYWLKEGIVDERDFIAGFVSVVVMIICIGWVWGLL